MTVAAAPDLRPRSRRPQLQVWVRGLRSIDLVLLALSVVYAVWQRHLLLEQAAGTGLSVDVWDQLVGTAYDPYLVVYLYLPWLLISAARDADRTSSSVVQLRCGSYRGWLRFAARLGLRRIGVLAVSLVVAGAVSSLGLPFSGGWSDLARSDTGWSLRPVLDLGLPPLVASVANPVVSGVFALGLYCLVCALVTCLGRRWLLIAPAGLWFWTVLSFRVSDGWAPVLKISDGFQLHQSVLDHGSLVGAVLAAAVPLLVVAGLGFLLDRRSTGVPGSRTSRTIAVYVSVLIGSVALWAATQPTSGVASDVFSALYGASPDGAQLLRYGLLCIVSLGPAYVYAVHLDTELEGHFYLVALRSGSFRAWWRRDSARWFAAACAAPLLIMATVVVLGQLLGQHQPPPAEVPGLGLLAYQVLLNGALQVALYLLVTFLVRWATGSAFATVGVLGAFVVLGFPPLGSNLWLPSGLNSAALAEGGWPSVMLITAELVVADLLVVAIIGRVLRRGTTSGGHQP